MFDIKKTAIRRLLGICHVCNCRKPEEDVKAEASEVVEDTGEPTTYQKFIDIFNHYREKQVDENNWQEVFIWYNLVFDSW